MFKSGFETWYTLVQSHGLPTTMNDLEVAGECFSCHDVRGTSAFSACL